MVTAMSNARCVTSSPCAWATWIPRDPLTLRLALWPHSAWELPEGWLKARPPAGVGQLQVSGASGLGFLWVTGQRVLVPKRCLCTVTLSPGSRPLKRLKHKHY